VSVASHTPALLRRAAPALRLPRQHWLEILACIALRIAGDLLGRAFGDHLAPAVAALGPDFDSLRITAISNKWYAKHELRH
jgi:hypothetical protein